MFTIMETHSGANSEVVSTEYKINYMHCLQCLSARCSANMISCISHLSSVKASAVVLSLQMEMELKRSAGIAQSWS